MTDAALPVTSPRLNPPSDPPLPSKFTGFRDSQWDAIMACVEEFERGNTAVYLNAPTGAGKTLIAEAVRRLRDARGVYLCSDNSLLDQFSSDFDYARVLKGRANYPTEHGGGDVSCADCTWDGEECRWCTDRHNCPYVRAVGDAKVGRLAVSNTSYFISSAIHSPSPPLTGRDLVVIDEADKLERELMSQVSVEIRPKRMKELGIGPPKRVWEKAASNDWGPWIDETALPAVMKQLAKFGPKGSMSTADLKRYKSWDNLRTSLQGLAKSLPYKGWALEDEDRGGVTFKPVYVWRYGNNHIWRNGQNFLLMSATILSDTLMSNDLGLRRSHAFIDVPSSIPIANRPVICLGNGPRMTFKTKETAWPEMVKQVVKVLAKHPGERVLVHCVSYKLAHYLRVEVARMLSTPRPLVTYGSAGEKASALREYTNRPNSVLFASSMDRGVDLPDDLCRVQVVAKIPWPAQTRVVKARLELKGGQLWYTAETLRTVIQMAGRGVRGPDDWAVTYILDACWSDVLDKGRHMLPGYFKAAMKFVPKI